MRNMFESSCDAHTILFHCLLGGTVLISFRPLRTRYLLLRPRLVSLLENPIVRVTSLCVGLKSRWLFDDGVKGMRGRGVAQVCCVCDLDFMHTGGEDDEKRLCTTMSIFEWWFRHTRVIGIRVCYIKSAKLWNS